MAASMCRHLAGTTRMGKAREWAGNVGVARARGVGAWGGAEEAAAAVGAGAPLAGD